MMKRLVAALFFLGLVLLVAVLVVPSFIDWNQHKDTILAQVAPYFQRKIDVAGNISLKVLPQPEIMLESVTVANSEGTQDVPFMTFRQLGARLKLEPLLEGRVEIETVDFVEPVLNLEIPKGGKPNWTGLLKDNPVDNPGIPAAAVQLNRVAVTGGTINYINRTTGLALKAENLNLSVTAQTLLGPYHVTGDMKYRNTPVNIDIEMEKYDQKVPAPIRISLIPAEGLPHVKLDGVMDLQSGIDVQGELSIEQGELGSLLDIRALNNIAFLHESTTLSGVLEFKGDQCSLSDIKAKFGQNGELKGKLLVQFSLNDKPVAHLELEGSNLAVTNKPDDSYMNVPGAFNGSLHFKGKNIIWAGRKLGVADINAEFNQKEWAVKSAQIDLPGSSHIKLAGTMTPSSSSASYTLQLVTEDLSKLVGALVPAENNIFKFFGDTELIKKLAFSSSLDISPARISFFNIDSSTGGKEKLSGVINIDRTAQKPNVTAKLNVTDWDDASFPAAARDGFLQKLMTADADIELTGTNFTNNGIKITDLLFKGKTGEKGLELTDVRGSLSDKEKFALAGRMASLYPVSNMAISYVVQADQALDVAKVLGVDILPPPLPSWKNADIKGEVRGDAQKYTFTTEGDVDATHVELGGSFEGNNYQVAVHLKHPDTGHNWDIFGLPIEHLLADSGDFDFSGELKGTADTYTIDKIQAQVGASSVSGSLARKGDKVTADLTADKLDLDKWLAGDWSVRQDISLKLHANDLALQGLHISQPLLAMEAGVSFVNVSDLEGTLWGGEMKTEMSFTRQDKSAPWSASVKGSLKQADLSLLKDHLAFQGFLPGVGDIHFDLASANNTPASAVGVMGVKASTLKVDSFNFDKLSDTLNALTQVPPALQKFVGDIFHGNGAATFKNIEGQFKVDQGKVDIETLKLLNANGDMTVKGSADMKAGTYAIEAALQLHQPENFPLIKVKRSSDAADYTVDTKPLEKLILKNNPPPVPVQPDVTPVPPAAEAQPPAHPHEDKAGAAINGILQRLDEDGEKPAAP